MINSILELADAYAMTYANVVESQLKRQELAQALTRYLGERPGDGRAGALLLDQQAKIQRLTDEVKRLESALSTSGTPPETTAP